jgi:NAD-dependent SIR2 family protein deacetylase
MKNYLDKIQKWIAESDSIIIGAGAGLSAAGGVNYMDENLTVKWFPEYTKLGLRNIVEIQAAFWDITPKNALAYYAFWARHIWHVRYETKVLKPYLDLHKIVADKDYFVITTNVDRQFSKAGFNEDKILATQGDYGLFQCSVPCSKDVYENYEMIEQMVNNIVDDYYIQKNDIPRCPHCGNLLIPNLRKNRTFVEEIHLRNLPYYMEHIKMAESNHITLLELGVGFNTPVIIRYPFEKLAEQYSKNVHLVRVNLDSPNLPSILNLNSLSVQENLALFLKRLSE